MFSESCHDPERRLLILVLDIYLARLIIISYRYLMLGANEGFVEKYHTIHISFAFPVLICILIVWKKDLPLFVTVIEEMSEVMEGMYLS